MRVDRTIVKQTPMRRLTNGLSVTSAAMIAFALLNACGKVDPDPTEGIQPASLRTSVARLESDWTLEETGKAYWIGYTQDMRDIAAHGDTAIDPLVAFIERTTSSHAKLGGALTLHYIGIEGKIAGRNIEEFKSNRARGALLRLLSHRDLQETILTLLIRDPWPEDLPHLFELLNRDSSIHWAVVKALQRYAVEKRPVHQPLPVKLSTIQLSLDQPDPFKDPNTPANQFKAVRLKALDALPDDLVLVEAKLFEYPPWEYDTTGYGDPSLGHVIDDLTACDYIGLGDRLDYYIEDGRIYVCTIETARARWLDWHARQP